MTPPATSGRADLLSEVLDGLEARPRRLPCKYFYDAAGSRLFDRICELDTYYLTRTETAILRRHADEIAACVGSRCALIEFGSGSSVKTRILLDALATPVAYLPIDISCDHLARAAAGLAAAYPDLEVLPVCADYATRHPLPAPRRPASRRVAFFPGSTLGNLDPEPAEALLRRMAQACGSGGGLIIGIDLVKDPAIILPAYDDPAGVTAAFNLNLLRRLNRELGADFRLDDFRHVALWNDAFERIEMHLESRRAQTVSVGERRIHLAAGEWIHTENSHKYRLGRFAAMAAAAGWRLERFWRDDAGWFAVCYLIAD